MTNLNSTKFILLFIMVLFPTKAQECSLLGTLSTLQLWGCLCLPPPAPHLHLQHSSAPASLCFLPGLCSLSPGRFDTSCPVSFFSPQPWPHSLLRFGLNFNSLWSSSSSQPPRLCGLTEPCCCSSYRFSQYVVHTCICAIIWICLSCSYGLRIHKRGMKVMTD